jgi:hypothetical protein
MTDVNLVRLGGLFGLLSVVAVIPAYETSPINVRHIAVIPLAEI